MEFCKAQIKGMAPYGELEALGSFARVLAKTLKLTLTVTVSPDGVTLDDGMTRYAGLTNTMSIRIALESWPS